MPEIRTLANAAGVRIELADLGDWGEATLVSEYDPDGPAIRINERAIDRYRAACDSLSSCDVRAFIDLAVAHELYHHREATGDIPRLTDRAAREAAADEFARAHVPIDARLDSFLRGDRA
ncbi:MAG: hypothetical protein NVS2B17_30630 [Candidatus Velthaea sp.]